MHKLAQFIVPLLNEIYGRKNSVDFDIPTYSWLIQIYFDFIYYLLYSIHTMPLFTETCATVQAL